MGRLIVLMQSGPIGDYMAAKGHKFESFDKDAKDEKRSAVGIREEVARCDRHHGDSDGSRC